MAARQLKWVVLGVVFILAVVTGVLIATSNRSDSASSADVTQTVTVAPTSSIYGKGDEPFTPASPTSTSSADPTTSAPPSTSPEPPTSVPPAVNGRAATNVPMTKLAPGEKPPQFIIFSFDGVGSVAKINEFVDAAQASNARWTGFLTGIYLIADDKADVYQAPGADRGSSEVGFGGPQSEVLDRVNALNRAYLAGNEIGTHYNGHFCELGLNWSTAEWNSELDQNFDFLANWKTINGMPDAPDLAFPTSEVKGGRLPCLNGQFDQLVPAWQAHGMTYDSSVNAPSSGVYWPQKVDGIWEFYMPYVYSPAFEGNVIAMDYNMWVSYNGGANDPGTAGALTGKVLDTYRYMYEQAYSGSRGPLVIGNHFNNWNSNAFNPAVDQFMREACVMPDTYCATYQDVMAWMELQDPAVLQALQELPPNAG